MAKLSKFLKEQRKNLICNCGLVESCAECAFKQILDHRLLSKLQQEKLKELSFSFTASAKDFWQVVGE